MKKALITICIVLALGALGFFLAVKFRRPTLPGSAGAFGILPAVPGEMRSLGEIRLATESTSAEVRREALRSLGRLEDHGKLSGPDVMPFLTKGSADPDPQVRAVATAYLGRIHVEATTVVPLLTALLQDPDSLVRSNAALGLRLREGAARAAIPELLEALRDVNTDVRQNAGSALLHFPEAGFAPPEAWNHLSKDEAAELARTMGLSVSGNTLCKSVGRNDVAAVFILLRAGVDPNSRSSEDKAGETPLFLVAGSRPEIARLLIQAGADVNLKDNFDRTPWEWIKNSEGPYAQEVRNILRDAGAAQ